MSGSAVFSMGSNSVSNDSPEPPAWSTGSAITEWTLLGGWTSGLFMIDVTALSAGPGNEFSGVWIGLAPVSPATGEWTDVYSPSGTPVITTDGGIIEISKAAVPYNFAATFPINGNAYEVVLYGNPGTTATLSAALILHD